MFLIDTHVMIWILSDSKKISEKARTTLDSGEKVYISIASLWEIAIKQGIGKLDLSYSIEDIVSKCDAYGISILDIKAKHLDNMKSLPDIHKDPFDRLIVSQALVEGLDLISKDENIVKYPNVKVIW